jgi:hypothetical protein
MLRSVFIILIAAMAMEASGQPPLFNAIESGQIGKALELIDKESATSNWKGMTALHVASIVRDVHPLVYIKLLDCGADPNAKMPALGTPLTLLLTAQTWTPRDGRMVLLHRIENLLVAGAEVTAKNVGEAYNIGPLMRGEYKVAHRLEKAREAQLEAAAKKAK